MENNVLLGNTEIVDANTNGDTYIPFDGSSNSDLEITPVKDATTETSSNSGILLYGALALAAYFFIFKKK